MNYLLVEGKTFYFEWEVKLMKWIQSWLGNFGTKIASFISCFGEEIAIVAVLGILYWCLNKKAGKYVGFISFASCVYNPLIKNVACRRRPYMDNENIECLKIIDSSADKMDIASQGYSFPSGHSSNASSLYGSLSLFYKKKWLYIVCYIIMILVGISRFCLGVHYPTDVFCGWILGFLCIIIFNLLNKYIKKEWLVYVILLVLGIPGFFYCTTNDFYTSFGMLAGATIGFIIENKYVKFEETKDIFEIIVRLVLGVGVYFGLNALLKLPFTDNFLDSGTTLAYLVRTIRYTIVLFVSTAIYPMSFKYITKFNPFRKSK